MSIGVRAAVEADAAAIRAVLLAAFPTPLEADLVEALLRDGDVTASLVAEDAGAVVGHVLTSRMAAEADDRPLRAVGLAPLAVLPGRQLEGIGGTLVRAAIEAARADGEEIVFLLGEPGYYRRFGFSAAAAAPFASPYAGPFFMAILLAERPAPRAGTAAYAPAFSGLEGQE